LLTLSQAQILRFIKERVETEGISPSYREIQVHFGYKAVGTVQDHVKALIKKGVLEKSTLGKKRRRARGLMPAGHRWEGVKRIPIYGEVAAGSTRDTPQLELGTVFVAEKMAEDPCFALRVTGDSMIEVGIFEGDHLIVERRQRVKNGDIVVALVHGETTVKRYVEKSGEVFLVPENRRLQPLKMVPGSFEIQGKVVGLQRKIGPSGK
jgi:repressor LexA